MLITAVKKALRSSCQYHELLQVMEYAVFPAGKLFRPRLIEALALDLNGGAEEDHYHLAAAVELHHAYTLVHDDLPSMDNDLVRRGKPSTHVQFGEWKAILAGDALLVTSFQEIAKIKHENFRKIHQLMTWTTGAKGLIEGQFRDLGANGELKILDVVRIHELKTGRLIQLATLGTYLLSSRNQFRERMEFFRLGREIGVTFQLLDDLSELLVPEVSSHEREINPFLQNHGEALRELMSSFTTLSRVINKYRLVHLKNMLVEYFKDNEGRLLKNFMFLEKNIAGDHSNLKNCITSFASTLSGG
jgi:geranylgeranyl pyrophosphate synthase